MCIEDETNKLWGLLQANCLYGGFSLNAWDYEPRANQDILPIVEHLEVILDCLLLQGHQSNIERLASPVLPQTRNGPKEKQKSVAHGGDEGEAVGASSDEGEAVKEINSFINTATKPARPSKANAQNVSRIQHQASGGGAGEEEMWQPAEDATEIDSKQFTISMICTKFRSAITLIACLCQLATLTAQYSQFREFFEELQKIMGISAYGAQLDNRTISEEQLDSLLEIFQFQNMKVLVKKLKMTVLRNVEYYAQPLQYEDSVRPRRKPSRILDAKQDQYDFIDIWFRSMMVSNLAALFVNKQLRNYKMLNAAFVDSQKVTNTVKLQQIFL